MLRPLQLPFAFDDCSIDSPTEILISGDLSGLLVLTNCRNASALNACNIIPKESVAVIFDSKCHLKSQNWSKCQTVKDNEI